MTTDAPTVEDAIAVLEQQYPPETAEEWDAVGLACGDRAASLRRVLFAVDPSPEVIDEAIGWDADLLVTHHPLLLRPIHAVSSDTWKGRAIQRLVKADCALFTAHTNADVARGGVNDALAAALGLTNLSPLRVSPLVSSGIGLGRVGELPTPTTVDAFARTVASALPTTPAGVRYFGDPTKTVSRVAVCGGAGDGLLPDVAHAGVDVFVTADLRHHVASEHLAGGGPALIDPGHWASEWPWLESAARSLLEGLEALGGGATTVETRVSTLVTDPVSGHVTSP